MNQYLQNRQEVPPGGFRYKQAETNFLITAPSWKDLLLRVKQHRQANVLPIGAQFESEIETWLCQQLPPEACSELNPNRSAEVPRESWPLWAKAIALKAIPSDAGVGSTIERVVGPFGGDAFKAFHLKILGRSCSCVERRDAWDLQYPYKKDEAK